MKRIILPGVVLVAACLLCSFIAYRAGTARGIPLQKGAFIMSLDALQKLRAGKIEEATKRMEKLCFSSADTFYSVSSRRDQTETKDFMQELVRYRASYRTNRSEWTPTEQQLEKYLASRKGL